MEINAIQNKHTIFFSSSHSIGTLVIHLIASEIFILFDANEAADLKF